MVKIGTKEMGGFIVFMEEGFEIFWYSIIRLSVSYAAYLFTQNPVFKLLP